MKNRFQVFLIHLSIFLFLENVFAVETPATDEGMFFMEIPIVVTASKKEEPVTRAPALVRVITAKDITERGYLSIQEAVSDLPGIQLRDKLGFNSYIFMRGIPSQNNLFLLTIDGVRHNEINSGGVYGGNQYNLSNVERIEVVYSPVSALYGTNAISGIINIITKKPENNGSYVGGMVGNFNTRAVDFNYNHYDKEKELGFSIGGMLSGTEKADLRGSKGDNNWTDDMENFENDMELNGKFMWRKFNVSVLLQDKRTSRTTEFKTVDDMYLDKDTLWHIRFINSKMEYLYDKNENWSSKTMFYFVDTTVLDDSIYSIVKAAGDDPGEQRRVYRPNYLIGFENQLNFMLFDNLDLTEGIVWEEEHKSDGFSSTYSSSQNEKPDKPGKPPELLNHLASAYLQFQYRMFQNTTEITMGIRTDNSTVYDIVNTPRAGVVYNKDRLTLKFIYAEAFRAPSNWDYLWGNGNRELKPETVKTYELSSGYRFSNNLNGEICLYQNLMHNLLSVDNVGYMWVNKGELKSNGIELAMNHKIKSLELHYNYTYNDSEYESGDDVPEIAKHGANAVATYTFTKNIKLNVRENYLGRRKNNTGAPVPGREYIGEAFVTHATLSVLNYRNFDFHFSVKNLFDTEYHHSSNTSVTEYRQPQRTFVLKTAYKF